MALSPEKLAERRHQLAEEIQRFTSLNYARKHLSLHHQLYSQRLLLLAFQRGLSLTLKTLDDSSLSPEKNLGAEMGSYAILLTRSGVQMSPKLLSVMTEGLTRLGIQTFEAVMNYVRSGGKFDFHKLKAYTAVCDERNLCYRVLWTDIAEVLNSRVEKLPWADVLPFLTLLTKRKATRNRLLTGVQTRLRKEGFAHFSFSDLLALSAFFGDGGPRGKDMWTETVKELTKRPVLEENVESLTGFVHCVVNPDESVQKWVVKSLVSQIAEQLIANPSKFSTSAWLAAMKIPGGFQTNRFVRQADMFLASNANKLSTKDLLTYIAHLNAQCRTETLKEMVKAVQSRLARLDGNEICHLMGTVVEANCATSAFVTDMCSHFIEKIMVCSDEQARSLATEFVPVLRKWYKLNKAEGKSLIQQFWLDLLTVVPSEKLWPVSCVLGLGVDDVCNEQVLQALTWRVDELKQLDRLDAPSLLNLCRLFLKSNSENKHRDAAKKCVHRLTERLSEFKVSQGLAVVQILQEAHSAGLCSLGWHVIVQKWLEAGSGFLDLHTWMAVVDRLASVDSLRPSFVQRIAEIASTDGFASAVSLAQLMARLSELNIRSTPLLSALKFRTVDTAQTERAVQLLNELSPSLIGQFVRCYGHLTVSAPSLFKHAAQLLLNQDCLAEQISVAWAMVVHNMINKTFITSVLRVISDTDCVASLPKQSLQDLHQLSFIAESKFGGNVPGLTEDSKAVIMQTVLSSALAVGEQHKSHGLLTSVAECFGGADFVQESVLSGDGVLIDYAVQFNGNGEPVKWHKCTAEPGSANISPCHRSSDVTGDSLVDVPVLPAPDGVTWRLAILLLDSENSVFEQGDPVGSCVLSMSHLLHQGWSVILLPVDDWLRLQTAEERQAYMNREIPKQ